MRGIFCIAVSYRGATLAWEGKQLASWTKDSDSISYAYDVRSRKTVNGTDTEYYYNGSILMSLVTGDDTLLFSYDQGGNVVSVNHNGTDYYYLRNGQGEERSDARARHLNGTTATGLRTVQSALHASRSAVPRTAPD